MCCGCWNEDGGTIIDNEKVRAVQPLIQAVYDCSCVGGNLHIVLDDTNLEDSNLEFCRYCIDHGGVMPPEKCNEVHERYQNEKRANPDPPDQLAVERACCDALMAMTYDERVSALGLWDGCWKLPAQGMSRADSRRAFKDAIKGDDQ